VTTDSQATAPADQAAPALADTAPPASDTAQNTQASPPVDWQSRYKAAQAELTRTKQDLASLRNAAEVEDEEDDEEADEEPQQRRRGRGSSALAAQLEAERAARAVAEWTIAESIHGEEVIEDYNVAAEMLNAASTPADYVAAFLAFHERMKAREAPSPAPRAPVAAREQAVEPRVDSNRVDLLPNEVEIEEAMRHRKGADLVGALFRRGGVES